MKKMKITFLVILALVSCNCSSVYAKYTYKEVAPACFEEPQKIRCTCYCEHGITATGQETRYGIVAGKAEWLGYIAEIN